MRVKAKIFFVMLFCLSCGFAVSQNYDSTYSDRQVIQRSFDKSYDEITAMLEGRQALSFKRAVYLVENAFYSDSLNYDFFTFKIEQYKKLTHSVFKSNRLQGYNASDSLSESKNAALFKVFTDTIRSKSNQVVSLPFQYNFQDALGNKDLSNVFVTTLLVTNKGNCRSLPYLYKILTEELDTKSYLALAPMHIYIKQRNKNVGWYNVELTSGQYPKDAYLISTGYISQDNIRSGLYMDTLSLRESVALCLMDLCQVYCRRMGIEADINFQLKCSDKSLDVKPNLIDALLKRQSLHKLLWQKYESESNAELAAAHKKLYDETNVRLIKLDYKDVPKETFEKWYLAYQQNKSKYENTEKNTNFKATTK